MAYNVAPTAAFTYSCSGATCTFTDGSTDSDGTIASRAWSLGDGKTATGTPVSNTHAASGTYTVTLTVTDNAGASASTSKAVSVTVPAPVANVPPTAEFVLSCTDLACAFSDASVDTDGLVEGWYWEFGDGTTSTAQHPKHNYAAGGTYSVKLTVTDNAKAKDDAIKTATTKEPANVAPTADFAYTCSTLTCQFTDRSNDSDGSVKSWYWDFGDGSNSTLQSPKKTYAKKAVYTITLRVTDDGGLNATTSKRFLVK